MKSTRKYLPPVLFAGFAVLLFLNSLTSVFAITTTTSPPIAQPAQNILISSFGFYSSENNTESAFAEIYNQSDQPVDINNWQVGLACSGANPSSKIINSTNNNADGWLRSKKYYYVDLGNFICNVGSDLTIKLSSTNKNIQTIQDIPGYQNTVDPSIWKQYQRDNSPSSTRDLSGVFSHDYEKLSTSDAASFTPYSDDLYYPPSTNDGLKIVEIFPHSKDCLPWNDNELCHDYFKLYRSIGSTENVAPATYSLAYKSSSSATIHRIDLLSIPSAGHYALIDSDSSGEPISLTDSGGYVWLEDSGGIIQYKDTAVNYPSASSSSYVGASYIYHDSSWQWTSTPQPYGANHLSPLSADTTSSSSLVPCRSDQYRNPLTNRCNLEVTASTLVPCASNQYRNPATDRCNSLLTSSAPLKPCDSDQYRNPATNRCKSKASSSNQLTPCKSGWVRNIETNRCRKDSAIKGASTIKDVQSTDTKSSREWLIAALVIAIALGFAVYEWRQEILAHSRSLFGHRTQ